MRGIDGTEQLSDQQLLAELDAGGRVRMYAFAVSIVIVTFYRSSPARLVPAGQTDVKRLGYSLLALAVGPWAFPWGPVRTIQAIGRNLSPMCDVTGAVRQSLMAPRPPTAWPHATPPPIGHYSSQSNP